MSAGAHVYASSCARASARASEDACVRACVCVYVCRCVRDSAFPSHTHARVNTHAHTLSLYPYMCSYATLPPDDEEVFMVETAEEQEASERKLPYSDPDMLRVTQVFPVFFFFFSFFSTCLCGLGCL